MGIATLFKLRDVLYLLVIAGLLVWVQTLRVYIAGEELARSEAIRKAQDKADALANELVIQQAIALSRTNEKAIQYVDRIRMVKAPDTVCAADERMRIGNVGVRNIIAGDGAETKRSPDGGQLPQSKTRAEP